MRLSLRISDGCRRRHSVEQSQLTRFFAMLSSMIPLMIFCLQTHDAFFIIDHPLTQ